MLLVDVTHDVVQPAKDSAIRCADERRRCIPDMQDRQLVRFGCLHYPRKFGLRQSAASTISSAEPCLGSQTVAPQSSGDISGDAVDVVLHNLDSGH